MPFNETGGFTGRKVLGHATPPCTTGSLGPARKPSIGQLFREELALDREAHQFMRLMHQEGLSDD